MAGQIMQNGQNMKWMQEMPFPVQRIDQKKLGHLVRTPMVCHMFQEAVSRVCCVQPFLHGKYKKIQKNIKEINIKVEGKEWEEALDKAFVKANAKAKIDGFRPGKAPKEVFLKKYGKEALYMDAADIVLDGAYRKVFEDNKDLENS